MSAQTSYTVVHKKGYPGQIADIHPRDAVTAIAAVGVTVAPGVVVKRDSATLKTPGNQQANNVVSLGGLATDDVLGISIRDLGREGVPGTGAVSYGEKDAFSVLREGYIYCTIPTGGNAGDPIKFVSATGVIDAGAAAAGEVTIGGATLETQTTAGEVGLIRVPNFKTLTAGS